MGVWGRLRRHRTGLGAAALLAVLALLALAAPLLSALTGADPSRTHSELLDPDGLPLGRYGGISTRHWLGVEPATGADLLIRLVYGVRTSLGVALGATTLATALATVFGATAAYLGGWADGLLRWSVDFALSFPLVLLCLAVTPLAQAALAPGRPNLAPAAQVATLIGVLTFFGWTYTARVLRTEVQTLRQHDFVVAARAAGAGAARVVGRELLPNLWAPILVTASVLAPRMILGEATLEYLGVGLTEPTPALGRTLQAGLHYVSADPAYPLFTGGLLGLVALLLAMLADALRDALDPRTFP
jgi:peptide/nickel transport system permease protein